MSAVNPQRVKDLLHRFGWDFIPRLASLGIQLQSEAQILFVDSGSSNASDADDTVHGMSFENPLATIDYAIGLCTADEGSVILVAPGHNESLAAATIDFDVAGVTCIGLGEGTLRPRIDFDNAAASIDIGANNVTLINLGFLPSVTDILIGVDVETGVTNFKMIDCEFMPGEDGSNADEFIVCLDLKSGNNDSIIKRNIFRSQAAAAGCTIGIQTAAACKRVHIENNIVNGNFSTAFIKGVAADSDLLIRGNVMKVADGEPGIELHANTTGLIVDNMIESTGISAEVAIVAADCSWFNNYCVTADGATAVLIGAGESEVAVQAVLETNNLDHLSKVTTGVAADGDLSNHVIDASILSHIMTAGADTSDFVASTDSLEAIADAIAAITENVSTAVPEPPVTNSLHDILHKDGSYTFDNTTDSLEAIADAVAAAQADVTTVAADVIQIADGTLPAAPVAGSLARFIASGGTALGQPLPDSMSLVDIIGNYTGAYNGAAVDDNIKAELDLIKIDTDKVGTISNAGGTATIGGVVGAIANSTLVERLDIITADTAELQPRGAGVASKTITDLTAPGIGNYNLFTVSGPVKVTSIMGIVANTIKAVAINAKIVGIPTDPGSEVDVAATVDINGDVAGTVYTPGATFGAAMVATTNGVIGDMGFDFVMNSGVIALDLDAAGDADDSIVWYIRYEPLSTSSTVVAV